MRFTPRACSIGQSLTTSRRYLQCDLRARSVLALARERLGRDSPRPRSIHCTLACVRSLRDKLRALIACRLSDYRPQITPVEPVTSLSATRTFDKSLSQSGPLRVCSCHALYCPRHDLGAYPTSPTPFVIWSTPSDSPPLRARQATKALDCTCARHIQYLCPGAAKVQKTMGRLRRKRCTMVTSRSRCR